MLKQMGKACAPFRFTRRPHMGGQINRNYGVRSIHMENNVKTIIECDFFKFQIEA